jgi:cell division protein FtsI (penicillin-binding protein 3)
LLGIPFNSTSSAPWVSTHSSAKKIEVSERYVSKKTVPNVKGMTAKDAVFLIEETGMSAQIKGYGRVVQQSAKPGTDAQIGVVVELILE